MHLFEIVAEHGSRSSGEGEIQAGGRHIGIAVAVAPDPAAHFQKAGSLRAQRPVPAGVERRDDRQKIVAQPGQGGFHLVGHKQPLATQRPGLPEQLDLPLHGIDHQLAIGGFCRPGILQLQKVGDAILVIDHAFAAHFRGMGGQHRHHQRALQGGKNGRAINAVCAKTIDGFSQGATAILAMALPILGKIGEHRKMHEAAGEGQCFIEAERTQTFRHIGHATPPAMPIDRHRPDFLDPGIERLAAGGADHIPQQPPEEANIGILRDRKSSWHCSLVPAGGCSQVQHNARVAAAPAKVTE